MSRYTTKPEESKQRFRVGSQAFFSRYPDFIPGDIDEVEFEEQPKLYKNVMQFRKMDKSRCLFKWRKMSADEFVEYTLHSKLPMELGKFLVPEVTEYLGFTIEHLKRLKPVAERLDEKHRYEKIIYDSYVDNNGFYLTDVQREEAYEEYKSARAKYYNKSINAIRG